MKKQLSFIWMSLLLVLAACSDGLDNIEYNSDSGITVAAPEVTETTVLRSLLLHRLPVMWETSCGEDSVTVPMHKLRPSVTTWWMPMKIFLPVSPD